MLAAPDLDKKMRMEVDASDYATEGVLSMKCKDGKWRPVAYLSKFLNEIADIRRKEKVEKVMEFVERIKKM